jgi:hypothetical protein
MRPHAAALTATLALAALATPAAHATTVVPTTVEDLARRSDEVFVATPRAAQSHWLGHRIVTDYDLEVQTTVRGALASGAHVTLRLPGGVVGRVGQQVPGVLAPETGRAYMFFVQRAPDVPDTYYVTHLTASVLPLAVAPSGAVTVMPAPEGMVVPRANPTGGDATPVTTMAPVGVELGALARTLRSVR